MKNGKLLLTLRNFLPFHNILSQETQSCNRFGFFADCDLCDLLGYRKKNAICIIFICREEHYLETKIMQSMRHYFLLSPLHLSEVPLPFSSNSNIEFHSSSEKSKIVVEKQNRVTVPGMLSPNSGSKSMSSMPSPPSQANLSAAMQPVTVKDTLSLHSIKDAQVSLLGL